MIAVLVRAVWMNDALKSIKEIAFFLFPKPKGRLEDCKAWIIACGQLHDQILDEHTWSALAKPLPG